MSSALISSADASRIPIPAEDEDVAALRHSVVHKLTYAVGRDPIVATDWDWFIATALAVRDHVLERWMASTRANYISQGKRVYYLSLEFLIGRLLHDSLNNLGLVERMRAALAELGVDYDRLRDLEPDAALGNGGLGRLAACFMESMATLSIAAHGYGIRYDHGMFRQVIQDGWQQEYPENWLTFGNPWEIARPDAQHQIGFGGTVETRPSADGTAACIWHPAETVDCSRLRHAGGRLARALRQHAAALVGTGGESAAARHVQSRRPCRCVRGARLGPMPSRRYSTRATKRRRGRSCACGRNISSPPRRSRTWSSGTCASTWRHSHPPRQGRDPVERHASGHRGRRTDAASWSICTRCLGTTRGGSPPTRSPTPTTRCCPRRWKAGRSP